MIRDAGLVTPTHGSSTGATILHRGYVVKQLTRTEIDILYTSVLHKRH